jgi:hypothetical protein
MRSNRRNATRRRRHPGGTPDAGDPAMQTGDSWTIPFHVIMWTTISVGFIMMLVVFMMH